MIKINKEVLSGSFVLLIAFNIFSILNFIYQFAMARFLTPAEYGALAALFSIVNITALFSDSIQTILTKYSSKENNPGKLKNLFRKTFKKSIKIAGILFVMFLIIAIILAKVWNIQYLLIVFTGIIIFSSMLTPISRGIMQGKKRFKSLGLNLIVESGLKVIFAVILVLIGFSFFGAISAVILSALIALFVSVYQIRRITNAKEKPIHLPTIYQQSILIFIFTFAVTLFYTIDIVIAKIVFSPDLAGYYAIASVLGKILFWGTQPISKAMLPIISGGSKKNNSKQIFYNSLSMLTFLVLICLIIFYEFPDMLVRIFSGAYILQSSSILFKIGLAMALIAYSNIILFYKIAKTKESKKEIRDDLQPLAFKAVFFFILIAIEAGLLYTSAGEMIVFVNRLVWSAVIFLIGSLLVYNIRK